MTMGCNCGGKTRERWVVTYPGGLQVTKSTEAAAKQTAAKSPGATYAKVG